MKIVRKSVDEPIELLEFRRRFQSSPNRQTWKNFKTAKARRNAVKNRLRTDQRGLCAYCETSLIPEDESVEHFVPRDIDHDRELDWRNLLLCCSGGERPLPEAIADGDFRYQAGGPKTCGHAKLNSSEPILNPTDIPPFPRLFRVKTSTGEITPDAELCRAADIDPQFVEVTIGKLGLATGRLNRARLAIIEVLVELLGEPGLIDEPLSDSRARRLAAEQIPAEGNLPAFFTAIRSLLGDSCEEHLRLIGFKG